MVIRYSLVFLSVALAISIARLGGVELRDWNLSLLLIGLVSLAYWSTSKVASTSEGIGRFAPFLLPGYALLQILPLPAAVPTFLSPGYRTGFDALRSIGLAPAFAPIAVNAEVTFQHLLRILGYLLVFLLVREFTERSIKKHEWLTAVPLIAIAALEALWGIRQSFQGVGVTGTYANHNHFAGLIEMAMPFAAGAIFAAANRECLRSWRIVALVTLSGVLFALLVALLDSQSKMGLISGIAGLLTVGTLWSLSSLRAGQRWLAIGAIVVAGLFVFLFLPSDEVVARIGRVLTSSQSAGEGRWPIWIDTSHLIRAFPLVGCGLGNYGTAFLNYQTSVIDRTFTYAHNDYLQILAEWGVIGFILLACVATPLVTRAFRASTEPEFRTRFLAYGCAGSIAAIAIHSLADFNLYIPANALILAWVLGISSSLPVKPRRFSAKPDRYAKYYRAALIATSSVVVFYAPLWVLFETVYAGNASAATRFCKLGVCDASANTKPASVAENELLLRSDPASPFRWCDLGDALSNSKRTSEAARSFTTAVQLGPLVPPVLLRAASFEADHGDANNAVTLTARILSQTTTYNRPIFDLYFSHHVPLTSVLQFGFGGNKNVAAAYLNYLMAAADYAGGAELWKWMLLHSYANELAARDYAALLFDNHDYESAAYAWRDYHRDREPAYLQSNWIYNGDFEAEPEGPVLDWGIQLRAGVHVDEEASHPHTGRSSLRLIFDGKENPDYQQIRQTSFVPSGPYRFEAYVRTANLSTDEGVGFRIFDPELPNRLDVSTDRINGTTEWTKVTRDIVVPAATRLLEVRVIRKPSLRFDCNVHGTAWIDTVSLSRLP